MRIRTCLTWFCVVAVSTLLLVGCSKKTDKAPSTAKTASTATTSQTATPQAAAPQTATPQAATPQAATPQAAAPQTATPQTTTPPAGTPDSAATVTADLAKPLAEVQKQAQGMSVADLRSTALQYQQSLTAQGTDLQSVLAKVKEIPITDVLGEKGKALKAEAEKIQTSVKALKERFDVYYNTLMEKGGNLSGLSK